MIQAATAFWPGYSERLEIHGTKGTAVITGDKLTTWDVKTTAASLPRWRRMSLPGRRIRWRSRSSRSSVSSGISAKLARPVASLWSRVRMDITRWKLSYQRTSPPGAARRSLSHRMLTTVRVPASSANLGPASMLSVWRLEFISSAAFAGARRCESLFQDVIRTAFRRLRKISFGKRRDRGARCGRVAPASRSADPQRIPLGKGLGSSAAALTAGVVIGRPAARSTLEEAAGFG